MPPSKPTSKPNEAMPAGPSPHPSGYRMFTDAQLDEIHLAALEILRRTGVRVYEAESLALLKEAGCLIADENRVRFPAAVIENALLYAPSRVTLCDRTGQPRMHLEGHRTYFGTGSDLPNVLDLETGERRLAVLADVEQTARLADLIAMAEIVAGGPGELELNPFLLAYLEPVSPLQHSEVVLRKVLMMADRGLPFVYAPGPIEGASAPVTPAGSLAMAAAEVLSGLAITQLRRKGAPFVWGSGSGPLDMRSLVGTYASPEFMLHCMGMAEMAHYYYHLPAWGFSGCSDAKLPNIQAGIESALWILWTALSGANLVHDIGYVESGLTCSYEMIVICDEIISFVRRLLRGIDLSPETLALDVIDQVGPGGEYIKAKHTAAHYREVWYPRLFDRRNYHAWREAGQPDAVKTARDLARQAVMAAPAHPLPDDMLESLRAVITAADARAGVAHQ